MKSTAKGFTLIELLTVIAVIGILTAILVPAAGYARNSARNAKSRHQFSQIAQGCVNFKNDIGYWPTTADKTSLEGSDVLQVLSASSAGEKEDDYDPAAIRKINRKMVGYYSRP